MQLKPGLAQKFNDDLLISDEDQKLAKKTYPTLFHVLDFPSLRAAFADYDAPANRAKRRRRTIGLCAIVFGFLALLGAAAEPVLTGAEGSLLPKAVGGASAALGVLSFILGVTSVLDSKSKEAWLSFRLMTERMRQFHFQFMVRRINLVAQSSKNSRARDAFVEQREQLFDVFLMNHRGHLTAQMISVLADHEQKGLWLLDSPETPDDGDATKYSEFFSVYRHLRFNHQIQYANWMLRGDPSMKAVKRQQILLRSIGFTCIFLVLAAHLAIGASLMFDGSTFLQGPWMKVLIVWIMAVVLAARALEEGLQPVREVERYTSYRASISRLRDQFDSADCVQAKLNVMQEAERVVYEEMREFLRTNHEARFVM